jgi:hypothetical protein
MRCLIVLLFLLSGCHSNDSLKSFVVDSIHKNKDGILKLNDFNAVDWDKMYIIQPYSYARNFDQTVSRYKSQVLSTGIDVNDTFELMLLFKGEKLVMMNKFYTKDFTLIKISKYPKNNIAKPYYKKDAVFRFTSRVLNDNGRQFTYTEFKPL